MEISLVRHGKSKHIENTRITCLEYKHWIEKYDDSGVAEEEIYPAHTIEKVKEANIVVTSHLIRSVESAKLLHSASNVISDSIYTEIALPTISAKLPGVKLTPAIWTVITRCLWFAGYSKQCESLREVKVRAEEAAYHLIRFAHEHHTVVLVGHGFFNLFIGKELRRRGWNSYTKQSTTHWNCTPFFLSDKKDGQ
ncbi:histidine phosphatase family protein [Halobacillus hunanensis]|uniref:histidine phosphatase family protein n=1 Tax=Halobacillus hunanensis TaxID=578214 RepID=UPI0009A69EED|nr:histidine phosphatase family protein [Halobacillus hunanensis]